MKKVLFVLKIVKAFSDAAQKFVSDVDKIMAEQTATTVVDITPNTPSTPDNECN